MKRMLLLAALAGTLPAAAVLAQAPAGRLNLDRAQTIAKEVCAACHGADGNSASADFPKIAGQHYDYLVKSLQGYKSGARKNPIMAPMGANLSQRDIEDLAAYFSQQQGLTTFK